MGDRYATTEIVSPIGKLRLAVTETGVVQITLPVSSGTGFKGGLARSLVDAQRVEWLPLLDKSTQQLTEYFAGQRREFDVPLDLRGTPFQLQVWRVLNEIAFGQICSYGDVAAKTKSPKAYRAVGLANGANPVPIIVPCHRVIASGGKIGGYGGGLRAKRWLLAHEQQGALL